MSETPNETLSETPTPPKKSTSKETIAVVITLGIVSVVCIVACAAVSIVYILNAPW